jgi:hypothetical protein
MEAAATQDPNLVKSYMQQAIGEFTSAIWYFDQVDGDEALSANLRKVVGMAPSTAQEWVDTHVDSSIMTALVDVGKGYIADAQSGLTLMTGAIGSALKWAGIALAALVGVYFLVKK